MFVQHLLEIPSVLAMDPELVILDPSEIPLLRQAVVFLSKIREAPPLKVTQKGNLPRSFVHAINHLVATSDPELQKIQAKYKPSSEWQAHRLHRLRLLLTMAGCIKKRSGYFSLTRVGDDILRASDWGGLYYRLFMVLGWELNWGFQDSFDELPVIQAAVVFELYIVREMATDYTRAEDMAQAFLRAFPGAMDEVTVTIDPPEISMMKCFSARFLDGFCIPLGLTQSAAADGFHGDLDTEHRQTDLFRRSLAWGI